MDRTVETLFNVKFASGPNNTYGLVIAVVPEPGTWAGGALLLAGAGLTLRRRLRRA